MSEINPALKHIAIIMDGNGRWAKARLLPRLAGHKAGLDSVRRAVEWCSKEKIPNLTLFAFSSENWSRPETEVSGLMELFITAFKNELTKLHKNQVQIKFIGCLTGLSQKLQDWIAHAHELTKNNNGLKLIVAINYGGRWDIAQAMQSIIRDKITEEKITEDLIKSYLSTAQIPDPDLLIRTSGETRMSNFLLWQLAYTELYFTDVFWPDFNEEHFKQAINYFQNRQRRFGKIAEQL